MTEAQMKKKMAKIEKQMERLVEDIKIIEPIRKKSMRWLTVSAVGYVTGLVMLNPKPLAGLAILVGSLLAFLLHRSYDKEANQFVREITDKQAKLTKEHLHLRVRSDPDGFIRSVLEGTLND